MVPGKEYKFRDDLKNHDTVPIELLTEPWQGVILKFLTVGVREQENGTAVLRFTYELIDMGKHTETNLRNSKKFEEFVGLILNMMILETSEGPNAEDIREDDTDELTEE